MNALPGLGQPVGSSEAWRTAVFEAGHAVAGWRLGRPLDAVSIRPGAAFMGIAWVETGIGAAAVDDFAPHLPVILQADTTRLGIERSIVIYLAGPASESTAGALASTGYSEPGSCEVAAERAAAGLADLSPRHRDLIVTAEADATELTTDEAVAANLSWALTGAHDEAVLHAVWLRTVAQRLVVADRHRITAVAGALLERTVLSGDDVLTIVEKETPDMFRRKKSTPESAPPRSSDGTPIVTPQPLTLDHPNAVVATWDFSVGFVSLPSGHIAPGMTRVSAGTLADDRSSLVVKARSEWRRPTKAERAGA